MTPKDNTNNNMSPEEDIHRCDENQHEDEAVQSVHDTAEENVVDNETSVHDVWGASGYTPLNDVNFGDMEAFVFSNGMSDTEDDDEEGEDYGDQNTEHGDFRSIADQALQSLEADYLTTIQSEIPREEPLQAGLDDDGDGEVETTSNHRSDRADESFNFEAAFENVDDIVVPPSIPENSSACRHEHIDTDAVRKAVHAIRLRDPKLTKSMRDWEDAQKLAAARVPSYHKLIPSAPLAAFTKQTSKARDASANLSRSATMAEALIRLDVLKQQDELTIDVVGCDHVECETIDQIRTFFAPVIRWIGANAHAPGSLELRLIGPGIPQGAKHFSPVEFDAVIDQNERKRLKKATVSCHRCTYDEFLSENAGSSELTIAFNAGVWGYKEWRETIQNLIRRETQNRTHFVVTAYTLPEAEDDAEVIREELSEIAPDLEEEACLFEPEYNSFASRIDRPTQSAAPGRRYRENAAWQAWRL